MTLIIRKYSGLNFARAAVNGQTVIENTDKLDFKKFLKAVYRHHNMDYPKYFKMDNLSKLGFITMGMLLENESLTEQYASDKIGMIITNASSSVEIDKKHWDTIKNRNNYFPSPSNFVYTLPNIMAGEAAIRHQLKGENTVIISEAFNPVLICETTQMAFLAGVVECCICGWVEQNENNYESLLFIVEERDIEHTGEKSAEDIIFEPSKLLDIYKQQQEWKN